MFSLRREMRFQELRRVIWCQSLPLRKVGASSPQALSRRAGWLSVQQLLHQPRQASSRLHTAGAPPELHGHDLAYLVLIFAFVDQPCRAGFGYKQPGPPGQNGVQCKRVSGGSGSWEILYETRNPPESEQEGYFGIVSTTVDESADKLPCVSADCTA